MMGDKERKVEREQCFCPYCDEEIAEASFPYCEACRVTIFNCPKCGKPVPQGKGICPNCGADIGDEAKKED